MNDQHFKKTYIEKSIILLPQQLDKNYEQTLFEMIQKECENICIKDIGYIRKLVKINKIVHNDIMKMTPNVNLKLLLEVESYLPQVGDQLQIKVEFIFTHGIFANFNTLKLLIPIHNCTPYELCQEKNDFYLIHSKTKQKIQKEDIISIEITNIRFEKNNYSCLGKII